MMTCIKCKQEFSEENHECLEEVSLEELMLRGGYPNSGATRSLVVHVPRRSGHGAYQRAVKLAEERIQALLDGEFDA